LRDQGQLVFWLSPGWGIMESSHLLLLLALLGLAALILIRMILLLLRGAAKARTGESLMGAENTGTSPTFPGPVPDGINWREINALAIFSPVPEKPYLRFLRHLRLPKMLWRSAAGDPGEDSPVAMQQDAVADPVDGTPFQPGESVLRCSCGTSYHAHSWQWIGEKNGGRCVNCKQVRDLITMAG